MFDRKEVNVNRNDTGTECTSVEDPLNKNRTTSIPNIINKENVIIAPGQGKKTVLILRDVFEEAFLYLLPKGRFAIMLFKMFL